MRLPNQHNPLQISFTRVHASWEKEKTLLAQKNKFGVYFFLMFVTSFQISWQTINKILFQAHLAGGLKPSEKYESVKWDDDMPN